MNVSFSSLEIGIAYCTYCMYMLTPPAFFPTPGDFATGVLVDHPDSC